MRHLQEVGVENLNVLQRKHLTSAFTNLVDSSPLSFVDIASDILDLGLAMLVRESDACISCVFFACLVRDKLIFQQ